MTMPKDLLFIRHGESEANIVQKHDDHGLGMDVTQEIFARPDWQHRLTAKGIEQAKRAKEYIDRELGGLASFDSLYVSPFFRTRETAAHVGGLALEGWTIDDRLIERGWGVYGKMSRAEQKERFPLTAAEKASNPSYVRLDGGESMGDVYGRFRDFRRLIDSIGIDITSPAQLGLHVAWVFRIDARVVQQRTVADLVLPVIINLFPLFRHHPLDTIP